MIWMTDDIAISIAAVCSAEWTKDKTVIVSLSNGKVFESDPSLAQEIWNAVVVRRTAE